MPADYKEAIAALNGLQTNHAILDKVIKERQKNVHLNIPLTKKFLEISGMTMQDLEQLKVIHVSGTKGKGWDLSSKLFDILYYIIEII